jgi:hypothetical protein
MSENRQTVGATDVVDAEIDKRPIQPGLADPAGMADTPVSATNSRCVFILRSSVAGS